MKSAMQLSALLCAAATAAIAGSWSGALVDANCYRNELDNVGPGQSVTYSGRDMQYSVQYCSPNVKTKTFGVVEDNWNLLRLDPAGNAKAAELVRQTGKQRLLEVKVTGEIDKNTVKVDSISRTTPAS